MPLDAPTATIIGATIGATVASVMTGLFVSLNNRTQFRRQQEEQFRGHMRDKLEQLHEAIDFFKQQHTDGILGAISYIKPSPLLKPIDEVNVNILVALSKVEMLVNFYAPELAQAVTEIHATLQNCSNEVAYIHKSGIDDGPSLPSEIKDQMIAEWRKAIGSIDRQCKALQEQVARVARKYVVS